MGRPFTNEIVGHCKVGITLLARSRIIDLSTDFSPAVTAGQLHKLFMPTAFAKVGESCLLHKA